MHHVLKVGEFGYFCQKMTIFELLSHYFGTKGSQLGENDSVQLFLAIHGLNIQNYKVLVVLHTKFRHLWVIFAHFCLKLPVFDHF